jgi:hypothetical protein
METDDEDTTASTGSKNTPVTPSLARRISSRRRITRQPQVLTAGKAGNASSFLTIDNPEATVAAYCGCNDIGTFRRFYTSPLVLPCYIKSLKYSGYR